MELAAAKTYVQPVYTRDTIQRALSKNSSRNPLSPQNPESIDLYFRNAKRNWPPDGYQEVEHEVYWFPPIPAIAFDLTKPTPEPTDHDYRHLVKLVADGRPLTALNAYNIANTACWRVVLDYLLPAFDLHYTSPDRVKRLPWVFMDFRLDFGPAGEYLFEHYFDLDHAWWMYMLAPSDGKRTTFIVPFAFPSWVKQPMTEEQKAQDPWKREFVVPRYRLELVVNTAELTERSAVALSAAWNMFTVLWESLDLENMGRLLSRK